MERLKRIVDPAESLDEFYKEVQDLPSLVKMSAAIGAGQLDSVYNEVNLVTQNLRTIRDIIDNFGKRELELQKFMTGKLPTAEGLPIPSVTDLYEDLSTLEKNFPEVIIAPQAIAVVTDEITLDEQRHGPVCLGAFRIVLDLLQYGSKERSPYKIGAVNPNYDLASEEFFHPHVSDHMLCEGAARSSIQRALDEGRFYDFFRIVYNTLIVYNSGSPHCHLRLWFESGEACQECGSEINEDDSYTCENCSNHVCDGCIRYCEPGSTYFCEGCVDNGLDCGCRYEGAQGCLNHENDACDICGRIPDDSELIYCDSDYSFHADCLDNATSLASVCVDCGYLDNCALVPDSLKPEEKEEEEESEDDDESNNA